ncbi:unnamed protein product [Caretta caretta]
MLSKNGEEVYSDAEYARQGRMTASTGAAARSGAVSKAGARCSEDSGDDGQPDWWKRKSNSADSEADVFKKMVVGGATPPPPARPGATRGPARQRCCSCRPLAGRREAGETAGGEGRGRRIFKLLHFNFQCRPFCSLKLL